VEDGDITIVDDGGITELDPAGDGLVVAISGFADEWLVRGTASARPEPCGPTEREAPAQKKPRCIERGWAFQAGPHEKSRAS
jgi:hypothetical protein